MYFIGILGNKFPATNQIDCYILFIVEILQCVKQNVNPFMPSEIPDKSKPDMAGIRNCG